MNTPSEIVRHWWEYYRPRPFWRMVELFVARMFRGGGDADSGGLDLGIGLALTLLAMPGGFISLLLLNKYASFLQWLRGATNVDPLAICFPDEYFFIVLSMTVTGAAAVWRWDAIFPDRRDYINLVPLPIPTWKIFFANLVALLFLAVLVSVDVNAVSCILFPTVVAATQTKFLFFVKFAAVHAIAVGLASLFSFFAVFSALGLLMAILPPGALKRISAYARALVVTYLATLLCTTFAVPDWLRRAHGPAPGWTLLTPSCWFLGLCQTLHGRANPALSALAHLVWPGMLAVAAIGFCTYAIGYRRHFVRIAEFADVATAPPSPRRWPGAGWVQKVTLRTPFQSGCFGFVWKTLLRSEAHRLVLTGVTGLALVLSSQALMDAVDGAKSWRAAALSPDALSIPFILSFLIVVGLRVIFEIPADLRSNWIFQLMLDPDQQECAPLARKAILVVVLPFIFVTAFPAYAYLDGLVVASLHTLLAAIWAVLLTNILLTRFRKLPFTCTVPVFKQHSIVILLSFAFGFLIYAVSTPGFESSALLDPLGMLKLLPVAFVAWYIPHHLAKTTIDVEKKLIFEEAPARSIELLRLGD